MAEAHRECRIPLYRQALARLERALWRPVPTAGALARYQAACRELEGIIARRGGDRRHHFLFIIPVADRPQHLENILDSLLTLCRLYHYGGEREGRFTRVQALIADDSREGEHTAHHRAAAARFTRAGLLCHYFGAGEQEALLAALPPADRAALAPLIGEPERRGFHHKGATANRNLAALAAATFRPAEGPCLFHFVDSDEQFQVRLPEGTGCRDLPALNYLYHLDRLFSREEIAVLTGKVVGDPPVSPAVMSANLLRDIDGFIGELAEHRPERACRFHRSPPDGGDAAYHDFAELFGFRHAARRFSVRCTEAGRHDHRACLRAFARRLDAFFDGTHPTRVTLFDPAEPPERLSPARTVYTGNFVCNEEALTRHFTPFAALRLRMAGPVLGRILRAELGPRFVTANLPLLHTRTLSDGAAFEYRPGVERTASRVDLGDEMERQFYGDVMLFTVEALVADGYPQEMPEPAALAQRLAAVEGSLERRYLEAHHRIRELLTQVRTRFSDPRRWWQQGEKEREARERFEHFFANIAHNFGPESRGYRAIADTAHRAAHRERMVQALRAYPQQRDLWRTLWPQPRTAP